MMGLQPLRYPCALRTIDPWTLYETTGLDQERTTTIESTLLSMPKLAEGAGFEPAEPVKARRFSRLLICD